MLLSFSDNVEVKESFLPGGMLSPQLFYRTSRDIEFNLSEERPRLGGDFMVIYENKKGFTLLEVTIVAGLMAMVGVYMMQMTSNLNKTIARMETKADEQEMMYITTLALTDKLACQRTLGSYCETALQANLEGYLMEVMPPLIQIALQQLAHCRYGGNMEE